MPEGYDAPGGRDARLGDQDQARRRRGASAEGLGASRESGRRGQDREGLGIVPRKRRGGQRPGGGGGRPGQRPRRDLQQEAPPAAAPETEAPAVEPEAQDAPAPEVQDAPAPEATPEEGQS